MLRRKSAHSRCAPSGSFLGFCHLRKNIKVPIFKRQSHVSTQKKNLEGKLFQKAGALGLWMGSNRFIFAISIVNVERKLMFQNMKW